MNERKLGIRVYLVKRRTCSFCGKQIDRFNYAIMPNPARVQGKKWLFSHIECFRGEYI